MKIKDEMIETFHPNICVPKRLHKALQINVHTRRNSELKWTGQVQRTLLFKFRMADNNMANNKKGSTEIVYQDIFIELIS